MEWDKVRFFPKVLLPEAFDPTGESRLRNLNADEIKIVWDAFDKIGYPRSSFAVSCTEACEMTSVPRGEGRLEACMKSHVADLSDACKVALANTAGGED